MGKILLEKLLEASHLVVGGLGHRIMFEDEIKPTGNCRCNAKLHKTASNKVIVKKNLFEEVVVN